MMFNKKKLSENLGDQFGPKHDRMSCEKNLTSPAQYPTKRSHYLIAWIK